MYNQYLDGGSFVLLDPEPQPQGQNRRSPPDPVSYTHLRAHET